MDSGQPALKISSKVALTALAALLILSVVCYKERAYFVDASYVLFDILNYKRLDIQFNRYGSFITQLAPLIGYKLHLPVVAVLVGYAASFGVLYLGVGAALVYRFKQHALVVLMALFYTLFVSESFYWISEIPQGIAWMFLLFGVTLSMGHKKVNILYLLIPFVGLAFLTLFTHFVIIIPTLFLWVYLIAGKKHWPFSQKHTILLSALLAGVIATKFFIALTSTDPGGDASHLHGVTHVSFKDILISFSTPVVRMFSQRSYSIYWISIPVFVLGLYGLIRNGQKWLAVWPVICCVGYLIVMGLTYGGEDEHVRLFHIESEWMCLAIIIATPFVFDFLPRLKPYTAAGLVFAVLSIRFVYICNAVPAFSYHVHFQDRVLAEMKKKGITKLALYRNEEIHDKYMVDWAAGYESTLMSAANGDSVQRTFIIVGRDEDPKKMDDISKPGAIFLWCIVEQQNINKDYFHFDLTTPYKVMSYDELMR